MKELFLKIFFLFYFTLKIIIEIFLFINIFFVIFLFIWQIYFEINIFIKKIKNFLNCLKNYWKFLCFVVKSFKIVLTYMFEILIYDILIFIVSLILYAVYKIGLAILSYDIFLDLVFLRYISNSLFHFDKLSFFIGLFFFQMIFLVIIYLQIKKVVNLLIILDVDKLLLRVICLFSSGNCYVIFYLLKKTYFIQHNFLFVTAPLIYLSIYILIFYLFFFYFVFIQFLFFILKSRYPKIKNFFLVQDVFYFLFFLLLILINFNYSFFSWLFLPVDNKLEESDLLDFLEKFIPDYKDILSNQ